MVATSKREVATIYEQHRIQTTVSVSYWQMLTQICESLGANRAEFFRATIVNEINRLAPKLLGYEVGSSEDRYEKLYSYWLGDRCLKASPSRNPFGFTINLSITESVLSLYGEDAVKKAILRYSKILHNQSRYNWCPVRQFEDWLANDIKLFLPGVRPSPYKRYARPAAVTEREVVQAALNVELWDT